MTIVAYIRATDTCLVDSLASYGNGRPPEVVDKREKFGDVTLALAGDTVTTAAIKDEVVRLVRKGGGKGETQFEDLGSFEGLARDSKGKVWYVSSTKADRVAVSPTWETGLLACGSGADWAYAYFSQAIQAGQEPADAALQAVERTVELHEFCGGPLRTF